MGHVSTARKPEYLPGSPQGGTSRIKREFWDQRYTQPSRLGFFPTQATTEA